jgi:hypothetical protein
MLFLSKVEVAASSSSFLTEIDELAFLPDKFVEFMRGYSIVVDPDDILRSRSNTKEIMLYFDDSAPPPARNLKKVEDDLNKMDHVEFVHIDTAKYSMRLEFDKTVNLS